MGINRAQLDKALSADRHTDDSNPTPGLCLTHTRGELLSDREPKSATTPDLDSRGSLPAGITGHVSHPFIQDLDYAVVVYVQHHEHFESSLRDRFWRQKLFCCKTTANTSRKVGGFILHFPQKVFLHEAVRDKNYCLLHEKV